MMNYNFAEAFKADQAHCVISRILDAEHPRNRTCHLYDPRSLELVQADQAQARISTTNQFTYPHERLSDIGILSTPPPKTVVVHTETLRLSLTHFLAKAINLVLLQFSRQGHRVASL